MKLIVKDQNGNRVSFDNVNEYLGRDQFGAAEVNIESSRLEGIGRIQLSDDGETIVVNVTLEEV